MVYVVHAQPFRFLGADLAPARAPSAQIHRRRRVEGVEAPARRDRRRRQLDQLLASERRQVETAAQHLATSRHVFDAVASVRVGWGAAGSGSSSNSTAATVAPSSTPTNRAGQLGAGLFWPFGGGDDEEGQGGGGAGGSGITLDVDEDDSQWTQEIPADLVKWGEWEAERDAIENQFYAQHPNGPSDSTPPPEFPPPPPFAGVQPPSLPAQLEKGPLNHAAYVAQGSGDDNSILPKPDHSVINHLAASPIKGGFLSVGVTTRYKRKVCACLF